MKIITILSILIFSIFNARSQSPADLWAIKFFTIDSFRLDMSAYKGKTIIIATIDASEPKRSQLMYLDSINRNSNSQVAVIGVFINDFGKEKKKDMLLNILRQGEGISFPITDVTKAGKAKDDEKDRHALLKWLIKKTKGSHFKIDFNEPEKLFVINKDQVLYAVLSGKTFLSQSKMAELLNKNPQN
jgi:hypothetical protein